MNNTRRVMEEKKITADDNTIIVVIEQGIVTEVKTTKPMNVIVIDHDVITGDDDCIIQFLDSEVYNA